MAASNIKEEDQISERISQPSLEEEDDELIGGHNPTRDALAEGIVSLLSPTLKTLDQGVLATKRSQEELSEQIALLTDQLKVISAEQVCPIDLDGYVSRLGVIKGKINVISSVLHSAQDRLNKVHEQALKEASRRRPLVEPSPVAGTSGLSSESEPLSSSQTKEEEEANKEEGEDSEPNLQAKD